MPPPSRFAIGPAIPPTRLLALLSPTVGLPPTGALAAESASLSRLRSSCCWTTTPLLLLLPPPVAFEGGGGEGGTDVREVAKREKTALKSLTGLAAADRRIAAPGVGFAGEAGAGAEGRDFWSLSSPSLSPSAGRRGDESAARVGVGAVAAFRGRGLFGDDGDGGGGVLSSALGWVALLPSRETCEACLSRSARGTNVVGAGISSLSSSSSASTGLPSFRPFGGAVWLFAVSAREIEEVVEDLPVEEGDPAGGWLLLSVRLTFRRGGEGRDRISSSAESSPSCSWSTGA